MPVIATNTTSTKFSELHLQSEDAISSTGGATTYRRRAFMVPSYTVSSTTTTYFLTLPPEDIKGNYGIKLKGSLNPVDLDSTTADLFYSYSYYFEIYVSISLFWAIQNYPTTTFPGGYLRRKLTIKNQSTDNFTNGSPDPISTLLLNDETGIVKLNPSGNTTNPDIQFGLNFAAQGFGEWAVSGMVYTY